MLKQRGEIANEGKITIEHQWRANSCPISTYNMKAWVKDHVMMAMPLYVGLGHLHI
jgi:hypothetical protein